MQVFSPVDETEAAAMVADVAWRKATLSIEGNGSKRGLGRLASADAMLTLRGLRGIVSYEPEELVVTVRVGTLLTEVERVLEEKSQCLAFEPWSWSFDRDAAATIGGTIAAGVAGSRRVLLGGARDHLIGFRAINGDGGTFKAGGKVVKNVTGYDLPKLAAGSFGTLFAMTDLTLRTYPRASAPVTLVVPNLDLERGCTLLRQAASLPYEASGFCYLPRGALERVNAARDWASLAAVRFEGDGESASLRAKACAEALGVIFEAAPGPWEHLRQLRPFATSSVLWRVSLPPSAAVAAVAALRPECFVVDWAGGLLWVEPGANSPRNVHEIARSFGGHAMLFRGGDEMRQGDVFQPLDATTRALTQRLKAAFDPQGIFNPGRMYNGI